MSSVALLTRSRTAMATEMAGRLQVRLLGEVTAARDGAGLNLGPAKQLAVFVVLATYANQVVSKETLIDAVWGESPPAGAGKSLHSYISRLRRVLEPEGTRDVLVSAVDGYCLRLGPDELDIRRFDHLRQVAQQCWNRRDITGARAALDEALGLWQGDALTGVDSLFATTHRKRLAELCLAALELRAETMIASADEQAVPELYRLVEAYPLRETLTGLLMTALQRAGRAIRAMEAFYQTEQLLIDQLGIEPSAALRRIHDEIVADLKRPGAVAPAGLVPAALVGRGEELSLVRSRLADLRRGRGATVWVEGGPGCGKSALLAAAFADAGCRLLWGAGDEDGRTVPLGVIQECLGITSMPREPDIAAVERLAAHVDQLAAAGPVVLVLDDLQWADDASLLVWHRLSKIARQSALLLVGGCRPLPRHTGTERLRSAVAAAGGDIVRLGALSEQDSAELASQLIGAVPGPGLCDVIASAAGNPVFVRDVIEGLMRDDLVTVTDGVADVPAGDLEGVQSAIRSAVDRRLGSLAGTTREALYWAAVLGPEFDLGDLATVMDRPVAELICAVEEATAAGVLIEAGHCFAFRHSLLRLVMYTSMPVDVRVASHRQAAEMLDTAGAPIERVAEQLLAAPVAVDRWVANWLVANVKTIAGRSPAVAVELLSRAVQKGNYPEQLLVELVRLHFWLGRRPEVDARAVLAMTADPDHAAEMRLMLAYLDHDRGNSGRALEQLRAAAGDPAVPAEWRARHRSMQVLIDGSGELELPGEPHLAAAVEHYWSGRWDEALAELYAVMRDGPEIMFKGLRQHGLIQTLHGIAGLIAAHRNDTEALASALRARTGQHCEFMLMATALAAEQAGDPAAALAVLTPALDRKSMRRFLPTVVRLALQVGDAVTAEAALAMSSDDTAASLA